MIITRIEEVTKKKSRIYLQDEPAFVLYKGEVRRYHIREGEELSDQEYDEIIREVLTKRAKKRALYLLQTMDRTEKQLSDKLRQGEYPDCVIEEAIEYVKHYGYVNDENYARAYAESRSSSKSKRQIQQDLMRKGIAQELIQQVLEQETLLNKEDELIRKLIEKRNVDVHNASKEELYKLYQFLLRKGFNYENIKKQLDLYSHYV